ncbi:MAG: TetR family transcriptional regulator [Burkholderiaceae bacterium]|nr:TetR family transcriptional regulator [Burkholderiaceae bacterium]
MGRPSSIDRNLVLNVVESLVREQGVAGVTIGAVARAAGISKGGVQSAFGTKEQLLQAVFDRWTADYEAGIAHIAGSAPSVREAYAAHVEITRGTDSGQVDRAAGMMATALSSPKIQAQVAQWYMAQLERADFTSESGRQARVAFIAAEGAYLLRAFGVLKVSDGEWESLFEDIERLLPNQDRG